MSRMRRTRVRAAVLGGDVSRSRSPDIHQAAYRALGITGTYEAHSVSAHDFRRTVRALFSAGYRYLNVTIPHKRLAAKLADTCTSAVSQTGAANTLIARRNGIHADNTDGYGLLMALRALGITFDRSGTNVLLIGAGGAAAGALLALVTKKARVTVLARRPAQAAALKRPLPARLKSHVEAHRLTSDTVARAARTADVVVSAVPASAWNDPQLLTAIATALPPHAVISEMAYGTTTPLASLAHKHRLAYQDGLPMLVHQAAHAIEAALGKRPPIAPLARAVRKPFNMIPGQW